MGMFIGQGRRLVYAGVGASAVLATMMAPLARADAPSSSLLVNGSSTPPTLLLDIDNADVNAFGTTHDVNVGLDGNCIGPLKGPKNYNVLANSANTTVAGVTPSERVDLVCTGAPGVFTIATMAKTPSSSWGDPLDPTTDPACAAVGSTSVTFTPNTQPGGIARKLHGVSLPVTVEDSDGHCGGGTQTCVGICPPTGQNPAAPAVANDYLNGTGGAAVIAACQKLSALSKKNWRGVLISYIANAWMPKPESVKDDPEWVDPYSWVGYVDSEVNSICKYTDPDGPAPIPNDPRLNGYTTPF